MKNKKLVTLLLILAALVLVYYGQKIAVSLKEKSNSKTLNFSYSSVMHKIDISSAAGPHLLFKQEEGVWRVIDVDANKEDYAAKDKITGFLSDLKKIHSLGIASENPKRYKEYGVNDSSAVKVKLFLKAADVNPKSVILFGKTGPTYNTTFVRMARAKEVYVAGNFTPYILKRQFKFWRKRELFRADTPKLQSLSIKQGKKSAALSNEDGIWFTAVGKKKTEADTKFVKDVIRDINILRVDDFTGSMDFKKYKLVNPQITINLKFADTNAVVKASKYNDSKYAVAVPQKKEVVLMNSFRIDNLVKALFGASAASAQMGPSPRPRHKARPSKAARRRHKK